MISFLLKCKCKQILNPINIALCVTRNEFLYSGYEVHDCNFLQLTEHKILFSD